MAWMSTADEIALYQGLVDAHPDRIALDIVGASVEGRPIYAVRLGRPVRPLATRTAVMLLGSQHGDELAGREAMIARIEHLVTTETDTAMIALMEAWPIVCVPDCNPDSSRILRRFNSHNVNLNTDHLALSQPETRAVATVMERARPLAVYDAHASTQTEDVLVLHPTHPEVPAGVRAHAEAITAAMVARATAEGWDGGYYPGSTSPRIARNTSGLRYAAGVLVESSHGQDDEVQTVRHAAMLDELLGYVAANVGDMATDADAAEATRISQGAAGTTAFDFANGEALTPPVPLGYQLTLSQLNDLAGHISRFGLERSGPGGRTIALAQSRQPIIHFLLNALSSDTVVEGQALDTLPPAALPPATVQDLAPIVAGSHRVVVEVIALDEYQTGPDPEGEAIAISSGDVVMDGSADVQRTLRLVTDAEVPFPRRPGMPLSPIGGEVFVRRGVPIGDGVLWASLGYFTVTRCRQRGDEGPLSITGADRMDGIREAALFRPRQWPATATIGSVVDELVREVYPDAVIVFDDDTEFEPLGADLVSERSRYEPLRTLADGRGKLIYWDGEGRLQIRTAPDPTVPIWDVRAGHGGVLIDVEREVTRTDVHNVVVVDFEAMNSGAAPVRVVVADVSPTSPTRLGGRFGIVPRFYASPQATTRSQAVAAGHELLRRSTGMPYQADLTAAPNPALQPWDPVRVTYQRGQRERHVIEQVRIGLGPGSMTARTREQRRVQIAEVT